MIKFTRKKAAQELGIGIETLRYYEKSEIIPKPERLENGYRIYSEYDLNILRHIIGMKKHGFSLSEIKVLLNMSDKHEVTKEQIKNILVNKTKDIDNQINELNNIKKLLNDLIKSY